LREPTTARRLRRVEPQPRPKVEGSPLEPQPRPKVEGSPLEPQPRPKVEGSPLDEQIPNVPALKKHKKMNK